MIGTLIRSFIRFIPAEKRQRLLEAVGPTLDPLSLADAVRRITATRCQTLTPLAAATFLLTLDNHLYPQQGRQAVRLGNGVHYKHRGTGYHQFFIRRLHPGERVLDIGCGSGELACDMAQNAQVHVVGIELSAEKIAIARQRPTPPQVTFRVGDVLKELGQETFDVAVLSNVLEHLPDRATFLQRVQAAANPKRFLIRVPLFERDWRVPLKKELGLEWRLDPTHETEYTWESFIQEMNAARLTLTHWEIRWGEIWAELIPA